MAIHQSPCHVSVQRSQIQDYYNTCSQILRRQILHQKALKRGTVHLSLTQSLSFIVCGFYVYAQTPANKKVFLPLLLLFFLISQLYLLINFKFQLMGMSIWYFGLSCFTYCTLYMCLSWTFFLLKASNNYGALANTHMWKHYNFTDPVTQKSALFLVRI